MSELSRTHHAVIQALLSRGPLNEKEFHSMFKGLTKKNPGTDQRLFSEFLLKINKALSYVQFELRRCIHQYDGQFYYGVINTHSDEQSKLGSKYTVPQIAFYKAVIEAIVQDPTGNGVVSNIDALNFKLDSQVTVATDPQSQGNQHQVPSALKYFSISQKEKTLHELVWDQWLNLTEDGNITLGVKSFLDFRSWFRNDDVPTCQVCKEAGVKAGLCQNNACPVRIHHYCLKELFLQRKGGNVCPSCGTQWRYAVPKAEAIQNQEENEPRGSQRATGSTRERRRTNRIHEENVDGINNEDEQNEDMGSQHNTRFARKRLRTSRTGEVDIAGSAASQSSVANSNRRVTRSSSRLI